MSDRVRSLATITHAVRAAIQLVATSLATLSRELGINPKTVAKWRKRATVEDLKTRPKAPHSTTLSEAEEAMVVAFRRHTLLPLKDCLYALQPSIPHLTRSALHRCLQRHGISRLPDIEDDKPKRQRFKRYPIGFFVGLKSFPEAINAVLPEAIVQPPPPPPSPGHALHRPSDPQLDELCVPEGAQVHRPCVARRLPCRDA